MLSDVNIGPATRKKYHNSVFAGEGYESAGDVQRAWKKNTFNRCAATANDARCLLQQHRYSRQAVDVAGHTRRCATSEQCKNPALAQVAVHLELNLQREWHLSPTQYNCKEMIQSWLDN